MFKETATPDLKRVQKRTAERLFVQEGKQIYIIPHKCRIDNMWIKPFELTAKHKIEEFRKQVNAFEYYNCNAELGKYVSYYTREA